MTMYEHKSQRPITRSQFARRVFKHLGAVFLLLALSLGIGILGYMGFEQQSFTDAFENSAMLLGGMGQVTNPTTELGKLFAGIYALYAGLVFILSTVLIVTPVAHRLFHKFQWDSKL
ncbi:MAG: hypothetical protein KA902_03205 [Arenimonas sp.]|nr:hypothetical protein [Arenimonas sp.]